MNNSTGLDFKRYKRVCSEKFPSHHSSSSAQSPFRRHSCSHTSFQRVKVPFPCLYLNGVLYIRWFAVSLFFFFLSYNRTERPSSFFLQLHALLLFGVTEVNGSFLRQLTVLKVLWRRGERQIKGSTPRQLLSQPCTWKGEERTKLKGSEKSLGIH